MTNSSHRFNFCLFAFLSIIIFCLIESTEAFAHSTSESYLSLEVLDNQLKGQWDIALRDLEAPLQLDNNRDGKITWGELHGKESQVVRYALEHLHWQAIGADQVRTGCPLKITSMRIAKHRQGNYAALTIENSCSLKMSSKAQEWELKYTLLLREDAWHKGLAEIKEGQKIQSFIFDPEHTVYRVGQSTSSTFSRWLRDGVLHIWTGWDHILFLLVLLLPSMLEKRRGMTTRILGLRRATIRIFHIVSVFTIAHSLTLAIASLHLIVVPSILVESIIALSIVIMALNIIFDFFDEKRSLLITFCFGLFHGLGFASVFVGAQLSLTQQLLSLLAFNLGVELGQFAIVSLVFPLIYSIRLRPLYQGIFLKVGASVAGLIGMIWLAERALKISFLNMFG